MLQYRRIKTFIPKGQEHPVKFDEALTPNIQYNSLDDFIANHEKDILQVPETERVNVYCTVNHVIEGVDKRVDSWKEQDIIFFDVDDVTEADKLRFREYLDVIAPLCSTKPENLVAITTGSGFHILLALKKPIKDKDYFTKHKIHYSVLCSRINDKFKKAGLTGSMDAQVFAPNRMYRAPHSIWEKFGQKKQVTLSHAPNKVTPVDFDLKKASGLPDLEPKDQMTNEELTYIKVDNASVEKSCKFLKYTKENQAKVTEPQWYAMLSVIGRLDKGKDKVHEYSKKHPTYSPEVTDRKLEQALKLSGPRTCNNIQTLWQGCEKCPFYKKVKSPIAIKGKDFIATAHSGFHMLNAKGGLIPQYDDLKKFYSKKKPYINANGEHFRFLDEHWQFQEDVYIDNFAEEHFSPPARNQMAAEFRGKIKRTELKKPQWFADSTNRLINLNNGVLNIDSGELEKHSPKYGFKYRLHYDYDPEAKCPKFRELLKNITKDDVQLQMVLMEFIGYALSGDRPIAQKALILTGSGSNGKSTFLNVCKELLGQGVTYLGVSDFKNQFHLQMLDGSLLNIMEEVPKYSEGTFWEIYKNIVVGGSVTVAAKGKQPYSISPKAKLIMACNELPKGANINDGYFRRPILVPFNAVFKASDKGFNRNIDQEIIETELPGVLNICLNAYKNLKKNRYEFTKSETADEAMEAYKTDMDSVRRWCLENLEIRESRGVEAEERADGWLMTKGGETFAIVREMYANYKSECEAGGEKPVALGVFGKRQRAALKDMEKKAVNGLSVHFRRARVDGKMESVVHGVSYCSES